MTGSICSGTNIRYQVRAQVARGCRHRLIGKPTKSYGMALRRMADAFTTKRYHRADVIMSAEYYDPIMLCELLRC